MKKIFEEKQKETCQSESSGFRKKNMKGDINIKF